MIKIKHIDPDPLLTKFVRKITVFESKNRIKYRQKLTPSAFTYLSYNHKDLPISIIGNKRICPTKSLQISGPKIDEKIYVEYSGEISQILVEFSALGFYSLFHYSPYSLVNVLCSIGDITAIGNANQLESELKKYDDFRKQIDIIEEYLIEKTYRSLPFIDYIEEAVQMIEKNYGNISINKVIGHIHKSEKQLERQFRKAVGITPKCFSKILQLHYVISLMCSKDYASLMDLAYHAEFYDLPHFYHRFKELTGFSPAEFLKSDQHIALQYFKNSNKKN